MLLIPAENKLSKANPPYLTLTLMLLNIFAFVFLQGSDEEKYEDAFNYYMEHKLLALEKESFKEYSFKYRGEIYDLLVTEQGIDNEYLVAIILSDKKFANHIRHLNEYSSEWQNKRNQLNNILNETSTNKYAFFPSEPSWFTAFSHMFMHGDWGHLFGNMIFMFLFGYNLELLIGRLKTLACYFLSGLGAVGFFAFTTDTPFIPLVGASGAISGLMGGFAAYYGLKSIRYFYWFFIIFNYIRLPAFLVLLFWLGKELAQSSGSQDNVAYMAHFGGLAAGATVVFALKLFSKSEQSSLINDDPTAEQSFDDFSEDDTINIAQLEQQASAAYANLDFDNARDYYRQLTDYAPYTLEYAAKLFSLEKDNIQSSGFSRVSEKILQSSLKSDDFSRLSKQVIEILKTKAGSFQSISAETLIGYCKKQIRNKQGDLVKPVINFLVKEYDSHQELPDLLLHFSFIQDDTTKHKILTYLSHKHPTTFAGQEARRMLQ